MSGWRTPPANSSWGPATNPEWISVRWSPMIIAGASWVISSGPPARARAWCSTAGGYLEHPGFFLGPTILDRVTPAMAAGREEIFGPVLSVTHVRDVEQAIELVESHPLGNMAAVFTASGRAARQFREQVECGMIGINVGVAQPLAFYPFSGWKSSFYGDLHLQGSDGIEFYTRKKVVVSRW